MLGFPRTAYIDRAKCMSWLNAGDGLQPRAMTRDLDWGVPVPRIFFTLGFMLAIDLYAYQAFKTVFRSCH